MRDILKVKHVRCIRIIFYFILFYCFCSKTYFTRNFIYGTRVIFHHELFYGKKATLCHDYFHEKMTCCYKLIYGEKWYVATNFILW